MGRSAVQGACDSAFGWFEVESGEGRELGEFVQLDFEVVKSVRDYGDVIGVSVAIIRAPVFSAQDGVCFVASAADLEPPEKGLHE